MTKMDVVGAEIATYPTSGISDGLTGFFSGNALQGRQEADDAAVRDRAFSEPVE